MKNNIQIEALYETEEGMNFPRYIMYDVNNICNAKCPFCPQSSIAVAKDYNPQQISWEDFKVTIEEVSRYPVELVRFTGDGEPLVHPNITEMIAYARSLGIQKIDLTTNGSLLVGKRFDKLLESPPHIIDISLDAYTEETYAKYRVGLNFKETISNIHNLLKHRDPKVTKIIVSMISHPGLEEEVKLFSDYWGDKVDEVAIRKLHSNLGSVKLEEEAVIPEERWPCTHLWQRLVIDFRGHVRFCPIDWFDKSFVSKVGVMSLYDIWHGPYMNQLRARHTSNNYSGCGVCEKCNDWANTRWGESWLDMIKKSSLNNS